MSQLTAESSSISADTLEAYNNTLYQVFRSEKPPFTLKVNTISPILKELFTDNRVNCAAFITACNPYSIITSKEMNDIQIPEKVP